MVPPCYIGALKRDPNFENFPMGLWKAFIRIRFHVSLRGISGLPAVRRFHETELCKTYILGPKP